MTELVTRVWPGLGWGALVLGRLGATENISSVLASLFYVAQDPSRPGAPFSVLRKERVDCCDSGQLFGYRKVNLRG